jgi:hypothetical protein
MTKEQRVKKYEVCKPAPSPSSVYPSAIQTTCSMDKCREMTLFRKTHDGVSPSLSLPRYLHVCVRVCVCVRERASDRHGTSPPALAHRGKETGAAIKTITRSVLLDDNNTHTHKQTLSCSYAYYEYTTQTSEVAQRRGGEERERRLPTPQTYPPPLLVAMHHSLQHACKARLLGKHRRELK